MGNKPLVLWGGVDISPHWYNESPHPRTQTPNLERDETEFSEVQKAVDEGRSVIGVCRGAQLLCVFNKGRLLQHVPYHQNNSHPILTNEKVILYNVAADHHQVMVPSGEYIVYAVGYEPQDYVPEVVWWPETKCLAVQPHPEWMNSDHPFNVWLNDLLKHLGIDYQF